MTKWKNYLEKENKYYRVKLGRFYRLFSNRKKRLKSYYVYNQTDINNIVFNTPLLMVLKDYIPLRKKGRKKGKAWVGKCPFCRSVTVNDSHFRVSDIKRIYKCFNCGVAGTTSHSFLMRYYNKPFDEIIRFLNKKYHKNKFSLKPKGIVVDKKKGNRDEDLPF